MIFSVVGGRFPYSFKWHPNITETGLSIFKYEEKYTRYNFFEKYVISLVSKSY